MEDFTAAKTLVHYFAYMQTGEAGYASYQAHDILDAIRRVASPVSLAFMVLALRRECIAIHIDEHHAPELSADYLAEYANTLQKLEDLRARKPVISMSADNISFDDVVDIHVAMRWARERPSVLL